MSEGRPQVRRGDTGLLEVGSFNYLRRHDDEFACQLSCEARLVLGNVLWDPQLGRHITADPFVGLIDTQDPTRILNSLPLASNENERRVAAAIRRDLFWSALAEAVGRPGVAGIPPWVRERVTVQLELSYWIDIRGIRAARRIHKRDTFILDVHLEPILPELEFPGHYEFNVKPMLPIRRDDGAVQSGVLASIGADRRPPADGTIRIVLDQAAAVRYRREALLAFEIVPQATSGIFPPVVRTTLASTFPDALEVASPAELFEICRTARDRGIPEGQYAEMEFWDLTPCRMAPAAAIAIPGSHYLLATMHRYVLCMRLPEIEFRIERLFPQSDSKILLEITVHPYPSGLATPATVCRIEIELERSGRELLLVSSTGAHKAVVLASRITFPGVGGTTRRAVVSEPVDDSISAVGAPINTAGQHVVTAKIVNLSQRAVRRRIQTSPPQDDDLELEASAVHEFKLSIDASSDGSLARMIIREGQVPHTIRFRPLPRLRTRIVALDIGTMATAAAQGWRHESNIDLVELGKIVRSAAPRRAPRREADYEKMMPSICGVTISRGWRAGVQKEPARSYLPLQCRSATARLDVRLAAWSPGSGHATDIKTRLGLTRVPIEVHLPLYHRGHETTDADSIFQRGFVSIPSVKSQVCTYPMVHLGEKAEVSLFQVLRLDPFANGFQEIPFDKLLSSDLLTAVLDALLVVYVRQALPKPSEGFIDHDFVLTYPASIGVDARKRYREAFDHVIASLRWAAAAYVPNIPEVGKHRLRLLPESLAACFALTESASLWSETASDAHIRRLILFDIGAGTFDVSAIELQQRPSDEAICQTVCFALPLGGDVLDLALAQDLQEMLEPYGAISLDDDLLSRVEAGKRLMSEYRQFGGVHLPVALKPREPDLTPAYDDRFIGWTPPKDVSFRRQIRPSCHWAVMDLADLSRRKHLHAYLTAVESLIVAPTLRASGPSDPHYADAKVILSGRASLFPLLQDAVQRGLNAAPDWRARNLKPQLASDVLAGPMRTGSPATGRREQVEILKSLVAHGAAVWARREADDYTSELPPLPAHTLAHFALLEGTWDEDTGLFATIEEIHHFEARTYRASPGQSLFVVLRPPLVTRRDIPDFLWSSDFGRALINRCIRPLVLEQVVEPGGEVPDDGTQPRGESYVDRGSPLPFGEKPSRPVIELAPPGTSVKLNAVYAEGTLTVLVDDGVRQRSWNFSSTFTIQTEL